MAVGQKDRPVGKKVGYALLHGLVGNPPQGYRADIAVRYGRRFQRRRAGHNLPQEGGQFPGGVPIQGKQGAELGFGGGQQSYPILHRRLPGELVGQDGTAAVILDQHRAEQSQLGLFLPLKPIGMAHQVKAGFRFRPQDARRQPFGKKGGGLPIAGRRSHRVGLFAALQMDGVIGAAGLQAGFQCRVNHIVGRAKDGGQAAGQRRRVITAAAERAQNGHSPAAPGGLNGGYYRAGGRGVSRFKGALPLRLPKAGLAPPRFYSL